MKNFIIYAFIEKYDFQRGDFAKNAIERRDCIKKGAWTVCIFKGRGGGVKRKGVDKLESEGERKTFLGGSRKGSHVVRLPPRAHGCEKEEKISPFVKFEVMRHLPCILLHILTDKLCKAWSSMINVWIDSRTYQK